MKNHQLAIVIPAYKDVFFEKALNSLANQTNKNFSVYVGDDDSPYNLEIISSKFNSVLDIHYYRFESNIGKKSIIDQWKRCLDLCNNEKWIWLFSDDDIADPNCVENFYLRIQLDGSKFDVYRFNTRIIDDNDNIIGETPESPFVEDSISMAYNILIGKRGNSMPDHIFTHEIYLKYGFVKTNWAQGADWATSILFSSDKGICTIPNAKINWRLGNYNISGNVSKYKRKEKFKGHLQFLTWVLNYFYSTQIYRSSGINYTELFRVCDINLHSVVRNHYKGIDLSSFYDLFLFYRKTNSVIKAFYRSIRFYFVIYANV